MKRKVYDTQFILRTSSELKEKAVKVAAGKGLSLNSYFRLILSEALKNEKQ